MKNLGGNFYYRARGPMSDLLKQPFLGSCVLTANFCALALNTPSDQGNSFAILPGGILVLSLERESFQVCADSSSHSVGCPHLGKSMRIGQGRPAAQGLLSYFLQSRGDVLPR